MFSPSVCVAFVLVTLFQSTPPNFGAHQNISGRIPPNEVAVISGQQRPVYLDLTTRRHGWRSFFPRGNWQTRTKNVEWKMTWLPPSLNRKRPDREVPAKNCRFRYKPVVSLNREFPLTRTVRWSSGNRIDTSAFPMPDMANLPAGKQSHRPTDLLDCP